MMDVNIFRSRASRAHFRNVFNNNLCSSSTAIHISLMLGFVPGKSRLSVFLVPVLTSYFLFFSMVLVVFSNMIKSFFRIVFYPFIMLTLFRTIETSRPNNCAVTVYAFIYHNNMITYKRR